MIDLQAVYVRDVAELNDIRFAMMVRINDIDVSGITGVTLNGITAKSFPFDSRTLMVMLPTPFTDFQRLAEQGSSLLAAGIEVIEVTRTRTGTDGTSYVMTEIVSWGEASVDEKAAAGAKRVTIDASVLRLSGNKFDQAVRVLINKRPQPFLVESTTSVLVALPENSQNVESVDVITTAKVVNKTTFFEYLLGDEARVVSGLFKLVQQFMKVLMTTPGTDMFNKSLGGNMQNWVGQKVAANQVQSLIAKTILTVVQTGAQIQVQQMMANVPVEDRLSDVQVLEAYLDPTDPTMMTMSIKLNTFGGRKAFFSMLVGQAAEAISALSGEDVTSPVSEAMNQGSYS